MVSIAISDHITIYWIVFDIKLALVNFEKVTLLILIEAKVNITYK